MSGQPQTPFINSPNSSVSNMVSEPPTGPVASSPSPTTNPPDLFTGIPSLGSIQHLLHIKLTTTNYLVWKTQFLPILNCFSLQSFIDPAVPSPTPSPSCPIYQAWWRQDQLLVSWILSSLSEEVLPSIIGLNTAAAIWSSLAASYGRPSQSRILQLQMHLQNTKQAADEEVGKFLRRAKLIADELTAAGAPVPLSAFNASVFNNLHSDFGQVVTALAVRQAPVTFEELLEVLTSHEIRLHLNQSAVAAVHQTRMTSNLVDGIKGRGAGGRFGGARGRLSGGRGRSGRSGAPRRDPCPVCGQHGHSPYKCFYRVQPATQQGQPGQQHPTFTGPQNNYFQSQRNAQSAIRQGILPHQPSSHQTAVTDTSYASADVDSDQATSSWYPDTGATHHFTPNLQTINSPQPYHGPGTAQLGSGYSQGAGSRSL